MPENTYDTMPEAETLLNSNMLETLRDFAVGGIIGFIIGFVLKKALKVGLLLLAAFVAWQLFTYGRIEPGHIEAAQGVQAGAGELLGQYTEEISSVRRLFQLNTELALGFFSGLAIGLWRG